MNNRGYMRRSPEEDARSGIHAMFGLIIANLVVFIIQHMMGGTDITDKFALNTFYVKKYEFWRFFTAMFLHGGFMHFFSTCSDFIFSEVSRLRFSEQNAFFCSI